MPEPKFPHVFPDGFLLPAPAQKTDLTADAGISLGLSAAEIVRRARAEKRLAVIVCADAGDMIKLADELTWFDPRLGDASLRHDESARGPGKRTA